MTFRSFEEQYRHYMKRPGGRVPTGPVGGLAAWTASELSADPTWTFELTPTDIDELESALDAVTALGMSITDLERCEVDVGHLAVKIREWSSVLIGGRGIVLVRGFPVERWGERTTSLATWCLGLHLGLPGAQNPRGDLLGEVRDVGSSQRREHARLYQTDGRIGYHCDYADVVGLMCLRQAPVGGESRIASSIAIHDELWHSSPAAAKRLYQPVWLDSREEGDAPAIEVTPFVFDGNQVRVFYHSDYFRSVARHGDVYQPSNELLKALDRFDQLAADDRFNISMLLEPGDFQLVSNHNVVHARTAYQDDPLAPRHLLRLWLSTDDRSGEPPPPAERGVSM
jgi:hypothetical protein